MEPALQVHTFETEPVTAENFPVAHKVHESDPGPVLYVPKAHNSHVPNPSGPFDPALQAHTFATEPVTAENFPVAHPVQEAEPGFVLYLPTPQDSQVPTPSDPVDPALQVHTFAIEPVIVENFPVPHPVHEADPTADLCLPNSHDVHVPGPSGPVDPALQVHSFAVEPVMTENFPVAHAVHEADPTSVLYLPTAQDSQVPLPSVPVDPALQVHTSSVVEPVTVEDLPMAHAVHAADPDCVLYLPTAHTAHVPSPSDPVVPALHVHIFEIEPVPVELFPVAHTVHRSEPGAVL